MPSSSLASQIHHELEANAKVEFGFWIYIMSDCILFACIFATYAVLHNSTFGGPSSKDLFELPYVLTETFLLLISSFTYGLAILSNQKQNRAGVLTWLVITFILGVAFIGMEIHEFRHLIGLGYGPQHSAFLSAFFTLVGAHGLHVFCGLVWMIIMMIQIKQCGLSLLNQRRLNCLSLFWHFLDIIWIFVFTIVYLMGAI